MGEFLENLSRFPKFFLVIILGVFANLIAPIAPLMKRPVTAIALIGLLLGGFAFITLTLQAMLGLNTNG
jgi:uncharacterized protein YqhQ